MRSILFLLLLFISNSVLSDELQNAYEKEYAYLVAEKNALQQRLQVLHKQQQQNLEKVSKVIDKLQNQFLTTQNKTDQLNRHIVEASKNADFAENDTLVFDTTLKQAESSLNKLHLKIDAVDSFQKMEDAFSKATKVISNDGNIHKTNGQFFMPDGESIEGQIISIGRIAKYGISKAGGGILAPAGNDQFKVWNARTKSVAQQLSENLYPNNLDVFLYENSDKAFEKEDEKTFEDDIDASGLVGKVIIVLGLAGLLLVFVRIFLLSKSSTNIHKTVSKVNNEIESSGINSAIEVCKKKPNAVSNVIAATLRSIHKQRDHIEDIISETILHESSFIDRFGTAILVIAAISPLLGLLGTVTGMISTFDIITEYGTGDPKLLSSGISEALLTTKFGLVVAIPLLMVGNLLSSWGHRIKSELEQAALNIINTHKA